MLLSLLLIPIALAQSEFRELEVKGRLNCRPHYWDERVWPFKVSLVRQRRRGAGGEAEVIEGAVVKEFESFSLKSPSIDPMSELGQYDYFLNVDRVHPGRLYCAVLPKSIPLDWHKRRIDLDPLNLNNI